MLHRTQVLLEPNHYRQLKAKAHNRQQSLSSLVREIIDQWLIQEEGGWAPEHLGDDPMWELCGLIPADDRVPTNISENVDKYVYRVDWQEPESETLSD
jgi:hypothetical protein